ncbi:uncharacterized protein LOC131643714 [Vicia villosa]|uniref:uncharacterized protein LOC131643714 n=1 Tax=Vicia villosa TaxID=3911 RepID=UPI00273C1CE5|nr:uncharacterized protein LOC131643714 [Vicia villosa]
MVRQFMIKQWNSVQLPDILYHDDGYFILRFKNFDEKEEILMNGPYTIKNMTMLLRDWSHDFNMKTDMLRTVPVWVKLPNLPLRLWGAKSLNKIWMMIEVDATKQMPKEITIRNHECTLVQQAIEYEWLPKFCGRCQTFGHNLVENTNLPEVASINDEGALVWETPKQRYGKSTNSKNPQDKHNVICSNGFTALGDLADPVEHITIEPC